MVCGAAGVQAVLGGERPHQPHVLSEESGFYLGCVRSDLMFLNGEVLYDLI